MARTRQTADAMREVVAYLERETALGLRWIPEGRPIPADSGDVGTSASVGRETMQQAPALATSSTLESPAVDASPATDERSAKAEGAALGPRPAAKPTSAKPTSTKPASTSAGSAKPALSPPAESAKPAVARTSEAKGVDLTSLVEPELAGASDLEGIRAVLGACTRCKLSRGRINIVFGVGNPGARLLFVGEAPGEDEDKQGEPFVGKAGRLLTDIITKGMGLAREDVYIANVVKCRPPGNRNPEPDELVACTPFLQRQIAVIAPEAIVTLGAFATQALLGNRVPISQQRGTWQEVGGVPVMPTFHPAYLLRNASGKKDVWADIQQVMAKLELERPGKP